MAVVIKPLEQRKHEIRWISGSLPYVENTPLVVRVHGGREGKMEKADILSDENKANVLW